MLWIHAYIEELTSSLRGGRIKIRVANSNTTMRFNHRRE